MPKTQDGKEENDDKKVVPRHETGFRMLEKLITEYCSGSDKMNGDALLKHQDRINGYKMFVSEGYAEFSERADMLEAEKKEAFAKEFLKFKAQKAFGDDGAEKKGMSEKTIEQKAVLATIGITKEMIACTAYARKYRNMIDQADKILVAIAQRVSMLRQDKAFSGYGERNRQSGDRD